MIYESRHVTAAAGIAPATLRNWIVRGLVVPEFPAQGRGRPAKFSVTDLLRVVALARLVDMGLPPADAEALAERLGDDAATYLYLASGLVYARPSVEERKWRTYWTRTAEGWEHSTDPDPVNPTITIDAAAMADAAMARLYEQFPYLEDTR